MNVKAILFDKDGTLIDFHATWDRATFDVFEHLAKGDMDLVAKLAEISDLDMETKAIGANSILVAESSEEIGRRWATVLSREADQDFLDEVDVLYGRFGEKYLTSFPSTQGVLKSLQEHGYLLGIATNDSERNAVTQMDNLGWHKYFTAIYGYDSGHGEKPGPGMVNAFCELTGFKPEEILMVGDTLHDISAGTNAGALTIGVTTGPAKGADLPGKAHAIIDDLDELLHVLQQSPFC
ncbi:MAG: HAD family hydrolase [Rhizobiaceae bacterium]|nr:HAD family hydrolase [Rhizobiaceae bacterium]